MHKINCLLVIVFTLMACSQNRAQKTEKEMIQEMLSSVKRYKETPVYGVQLNKGGSRVELLANDIPLWRVNEKGGFTAFIPLNWCILKSGKQKLILRIYPDEGKETLDEYSYASIEVRKADSVGTPAGEYRPLVTFTLPKEAKENGLPFFETDVFFEAEVPFDYSHMLDHAAVLKDQPEIGKKVLEAYQRAHGYMLNVDIPGFLNMVYERNIRMAEVFYFTDEEIVENSDYSQVINAAYNVAPLENYELVFYANGKIARLVNKEDGGNVLRGTEDKEGKEKYDLSLLLYQPEGSKELVPF